MRKFGAIAALFATVALAPLANAEDIDSRYQPYVPGSGVSGSLKSIGSDSLNNLMTLWAEDFRKLYPSVQIEIEGKGSSTAPPALIAGTAQLGPMARPMKRRRVRRVRGEVRLQADRRSRRGRHARGVRQQGQPDHGPVARPARRASSRSTRKRGAPRTSTTWGEVGLHGRLGRQADQLFGRNSASGTYGYFKEARAAATATTRTP